MVCRKGSLFTFNTMESKHFPQYNMQNVSTFRVSHCMRKVSWENFYFWIILPNLILTFRYHTRKVSIFRISHCKKWVLSAERYTAILQKWRETNFYPWIILHYLILLSEYHTWKVNTFIISKVSIFSRVICRKCSLSGYQSHCGKWCILRKVNIFLMLIQHVKDNFLQKYDRGRLVLYQRIVIFSFLTLS